MLNLFLDHPKSLRPFCFQEIWIRDPACANVIREAWDCANSWREIISIGNRITNTARFLKKWNKESFGFYKDRIRDLDERINWLQSTFPTEEVLNEERILQDELKEWINRQ